MFTPTKRSRLAAQLARQPRYYVIDAAQNLKSHKR